MDWNHDGKIDGQEIVHFHEVINSDSNNSAVSGGSGGASTGDADLGWVGKAMLVILALGFISFIGKLFG